MVTDVCPFIASADYLLFKLKFGGEVQAQIRIYMRPFAANELCCVASLGLAGAGLLLGHSGFVAARADVALELAADR